MRVGRFAPLVVLLAALLVPAPAQAHWSSLIPLDTTPWWTIDETFAMSRNGDGVAGWIHLGVDSEPASVRYRRVARDGRLGPVETLVDSTQRPRPASLDVAVDDDGDALFTWQYTGASATMWTVVAQRVSRSGAVGPLVVLSDQTRHSTNAHVALTPTGQGLVVYDELVDDKPHQVAVRISATGAVGRRWSLPTAQAVSPVRATRAGDFVFVGADTTGGPLVGYRIRPGNVMRSRVLSKGAPGTAWQASVDIGPHGTAYVAFVMVAGPENRSSLWTRRWKRGGGLSEIRRLSPKKQNALSVGTTVDGQGDLFVTWAGGRPGEPIAAYGRFVRRTGSVARVRTLGASDGWAIPYVPPPAPQADVDADGDGVVVWHSGTPDGGAATWSRLIHRDGRLGRRSVLQNGGSPAFVGVTRTGRARVGIAYDNGLWLRKGP